MPVAEVFKPRVVKLLDLLESGRFKQFVTDHYKCNPRLSGLPCKQKDEPGITLAFNSGGPANVNDAVLEGLTNGTENNGGLVFGIEDGCEGIVDGLRGILLSGMQINGIKNRGEIILGSSRRKLTAQEIINLKDQALRYDLKIIGAGGDDTQSALAAIDDAGGRVIGIGKTVDDDLPFARMCFGHRTAIDIISKLMVIYVRETRVNGRNLLAEVMGRKSGSLTFRVGKIAGITRTFIPEEFTQQGLQQLVAAAQRGALIAHHLLLDLSHATLIDGQNRTVDWIMHNIGQVDPEAVKIDYRGVVGIMHDISQSRASRGINYNSFAIAEGIAERGPAKIVEKDLNTQRPTLWEMDILGTKAVLKADRHFTPEVGKVQIGHIMAPIIQQTIGRPVFFERLTYEGRCADGASEDIMVGLDLGMYASNLAAQGSFGQMVVEGDNRTIISVPFSQLERDCVTKKIIPRNVKLDSQEYLLAMQFQHFLQHNAGF